MNEKEFKQLISQYHKEPFVNKEFFQQSNDSYWEHEDKDGKVMEYAVYDTRKKEFTLFVKMNIESLDKFKELVKYWENLCIHKSVFKTNSDIYSWETVPPGSVIYYRRDRQECFFVIMEHELSKHLEKTIAS